MIIVILALQRIPGLSLPTVRCNRGITSLLESYQIIHHSISLRESSACFVANYLVSRHDIGSIDLNVHQCVHNETRVHSIEMCSVSRPFDKFLLGPQLFALFYNDKLLEVEA